MNKLTQRSIFLNIVMTAVSMLGPVQANSLPEAFCAVKAAHAEEISAAAAERVQSAADESETAAFIAVNKRWLETARTQKAKESETVQVQVAEKAETPPVQVAEKAETPPVQVAGKAETPQKQIAEKAETAPAVLLSGSGAQKQQPKADEMPKKEEAQKKAIAAPRKISLPKGCTLADIEQLIELNNGVLATEERMIYTTDPSVIFTFTGMTNRKSAAAVLHALDQTGGRGTFFVTERELRRNADTVRDIVAHRQEVGICVYPRPEEGLVEICAEILRAKQLLRETYGIETNLVKQFSGVVRDETKEAVSALGCRLIGASMNVVQSRHKDYQSAEQILPEIMGPAVFSVGRGWLINIRMDFYKKTDLAAEMLLYLKRKKIDNIAYNSFDDVSGINAENDSAYQLKSVGEVLKNRERLWAYPLPKESYVKGVGRHPLLPADATHEQLIDELSKRYIGQLTVDAYGRSLGFRSDDFHKLDLTGVVRTEDNVIFLTFDDWGHDASVNPILYVLRKHGVPATFFVLTHNVIYNPNLLRAIAEEGHDIASHTNLHKPMATEDEKGKTWPTMGYEEFYRDMNTSYKRLASVVGDLQWPDGRPVLTKFMRPPTLAISAMGARAILENGYEFIINGSTSTGDYAASSLEEEVNTIKDGLYYNKKALRKGAIFVMHMTSHAKFTPNALDVILTANEKKADDDPAKFRVGLLSDYLNENYSQAKSSRELAHDRRKINWW